jgi:flavin-dependent dehydrogenase
MRGCRRRRLRCSRRADLKRPDLDADVLIAGAGPAGVALALRLQRLHYNVVLVAPPIQTAHALETLSASAHEQLVFLGLPPLLGRTVEFEIKWHADVFERRSGSMEMLLVDRRSFHAGLQRHAVQGGVRLFRGRVNMLAHASDHWRLRIGAAEARARLIVDASGRRGLRPALRQRGLPLIGLHAVWAANRLPRTVRLAASADGWVWGAPNNDGSYAIRRRVEISASGGCRG